MFDVNVVGRDNVLRSLCTVKNLHILNETNKRKANEPIKKSKFNFLLNKPIYEIELNSNILIVPREENFLKSNQNLHAFSIEHFSKIYNQKLYYD